MKGAALLLAVLLTGCPGGEEPSSRRPLSISPGETIAPAEPRLCGGEQIVLSAEPADSGQPVTVEQLQGRLLVVPAPKPEGYRTQTVIVDEGLGSFRMSMPQDFSPLWRIGTPSGELFEMAAERDPAWTQYWKDLVDSGGVETRAISLDTGRSDEIVAVLITLTEAPEQSGDALAGSFGERYRRNGASIGEHCGVRANGAQGAYVEHTVPGDFVGGGTDRTQLQFLIPDPPNGALWGVTCDVPKPMASEVKEACRQISSTFQPLPAVEP